MMALHFVVNDYGLREHHTEAYTQVGRWLSRRRCARRLAAVDVDGRPETVLMAVLAFLAGGIVLNVLKEELPDGRRSRFSAFALGTAGYAAVLQIV
jgi:hypothetical protein